MVSQPKLSQGRGSLYPTVGKIVAVRALSFNRIHCVSNTSAQLIQQQSLGNSKIQQISISLGIWFGTRGRRFKSSLPDQFFQTDTTTLGMAQNRL